MKKTRMSIDDIHAMVGSIRKNVLNMRVTNIYDLPSAGGGASKTYIFKLHQPPYPKVFLLLESGVRFHTSKYARNASSASSKTLPSQFTMKLRKHLRGKRLVSLTQLEGDRVVDLTFGADQLQCHLILELYASGNIILTDEHYTILSLLRTHKFDENVKMAVKQVYPIEVLSKADAAAPVETGAQLADVVDQWFSALDVRAATGGKAAKKKVQTLKQLLLLKDTSFGGLGPVIVEHCVVSAGLTPSLKIKSAAEFRAIGDTALDALVRELQGGWTLLARLQAEQNTSIVAVEDADADRADKPAPALPATTGSKCGFIILKDRASEAAPEQYEEFTPFLYAQHRAGGKRVQSFDTFDEAVDEYFSRFEAEVADVAKHAAEVAAATKLAKLRKNQKTQIDQLLDVETKSFTHARLLEANQHDVENVLLVVRSALASGMDWRGLHELVRLEQKNGNPVASLIHELDLANNRVAILLCDTDDVDTVDAVRSTDHSVDDDDDEDDDNVDTTEPDREAHVIWIDLALSALANAREIYTKKKRAGAKVVKATEATQRAIDAAEKSTRVTLAKQQTKRHAIYERRKVLWFEKFHWFLSNEQYLVLAGKDAHQNELLVKRYLRKGDAYVHADLHGAATCIVRNRFAAGVPIPVGTLEQAGCMSVCRSNAWSNQVIAGAYWVHADQVSKTAPAGEYLSTGSFMIRGKKNYIQPSRLEMGLAILFRLDESSVANHRTEPDALLRGAHDDEVVVDVSDEQVKADDDSVDNNAAAGADANRDSVAAKPEAEAVEAAEVVDIAPSSSAVAVEQTDAATDGDAAAGSLAVEGANDNTSAGASERPGKKRMSAKERRDLKKGKAPGAATTNNDALSEQPVKQSSKQSTSTSSKAVAATAAEAAATKNVRGKKGKLKKLKKKYADQDDEERQLRMEALGHAVATADDDECDAEADATDDANTVKPATGSTGTRTSKGDATVGAVDDAYIREVREKKEKFLDEQEDEADGAAFFDAFTGAPLPHDLVLYAVPMCAPYASLQKFKYKVKLLPGSQKKGKAAKQAMDYFFQSVAKFEKDAAKAQAIARTTRVAGAEDDGEEVATPDVDPLVVQRELMKCIPENELVNCMVGPVKISAPGIYGASAGGSKKSGSGGAKKAKSKKSDLVTLLQQHRAARIDGLERDVAFSWLRTLLAAFSYALLLSDVLRTGMAIREYPHRAFETNQLIHFGPYAYPVVHLRHNETSAAASGGVDTQNIWTYKYDTTSIGMRTVAEHLRIKSWPPCVLYKTKCETRLITFSTIFGMLDSLVAAVAQHKSTRMPINLTMRTKNAWVDRIHHLILPWFFTSFMTRTTQAIYYDADTLTSPDFQFCSTNRVQPYACMDIWTRYSRLCEKQDTECTSVNRVFEHAMTRLRSLQQRYSGMTLDLVVLESQDDNSKPALSFQGRKWFDVVVFTRVRDCNNSSRGCVTIAIDDYRYEGASHTSIVVDSYFVIAVLRSLGQLYAWIRVTMLVVGCYTARAAEPKFVRAGFFTRLFAALHTVFLVPSQVVTYGSVFPIVCYVVAHTLDSATVYELVAHKFNSPLGVFQLNLKEFVQLSAVSMRSVWVLALLLHVVLYLRTRGNHAAGNAIAGVPEFLITSISCLTIMAQFRSIYFRDSRVLTIAEVVPSTRVAAIRASSYNNAYSIWGLVLVGNTLDAKCLIGSTVVHLVIIVAIWASLRMLQSFRYTKHVFKLALPKSRVSYAAGALWSANALVVSWGGLDTSHGPTQQVAAAGSPTVASTANAVPSASVTPISRANSNKIGRATRAESASHAPVRRHSLTNQIRSIAPTAKMIFKSQRFSLGRIAPEPLLSSSSRQAPNRYSFTLLDERSSETESMVYLMNLAAMTDPIVLLQLCWLGGGKTIGIYESRATQRLFLLPQAVRTRSCSSDEIDWGDYMLLLCVSTKDLSDLLHCG